MAIGLFIVLFTVRAALRQVALRLGVAGRKVERHVAALTARVEAAEARTLVQLAEERVATRRRFDSLVEQIRKEAAVHLAASRTEAARATRMTFEGAQKALRQEFSTAHPTREEVARLSAALDSTRARLDALRAEAAVFEETLDERSRAVAEMLAHDTSELHASLIRARAEILRTVQDEVQKIVRASGNAPHNPSARRAVGVRAWLGTGGR